MVQNSPRFKPSPPNCFKNLKTSYKFTKTQEILEKPYILHKIQRTSIARTPSQCLPKPQNYPNLIPDTSYSPKPNKTCVQQPAQPTYNSCLAIAQKPNTFPSKNTNLSNKPKPCKQSSQSNSNTPQLDYKTQTNNHTICTMYRIKKTAKQQQKQRNRRTYQCNGKISRTQKFIGKSLSSRSQSQLFKTLQNLPAHHMFLLTKFKHQTGQTNRNLFQEHETPSRTSNSAPKDPPKTSNPQRSSQGRPTTPKEIEMAEATSSKRHSNEDTNNPRKRSLMQQKSNLQHIQNTEIAIWLGFPTMEEIARQAGIQPIDQSCPRSNEKAGLSTNEALELAAAKVAFPRIRQQAWPNTRSDNKMDNHFNLTQLPFDVQVDTATNFARTYPIMLHFEKPIKEYLSSEIIELTNDRFQRMDILLGDILEPTAPLCSTRDPKAWNGMTKIHLKDSVADGSMLLTGLGFLPSHWTES
jgi:hypothetical protein